MAAEYLLSSAIVRYGTVLKGSKADGTKKVYLARLNWLRTYLDNPPLAAITLADLEPAQAAYRETRSDNTTSLTITAWKQFFHWCQRVGLRTDNPTLFLDPPRRTEAKPRPLEEHVFEVVRSVMKAEAVSEDWESQRNATLTLTLGFTGIRREEAQRVKWPDVDLHVRKMEILGKGQKPRTVPIPLVLLPRLVAFHTTSQRDYGHVFGHQDGTPIHVYSINAIFARWVSEKIGTRLTPHVLRHTYATRLAETGASLEEIGEILGHTSMRTTKIYVAKRINPYLAVVDKLS